MLIIKGDQDNALQNNNTADDFNAPFVAVPLTAITARDIVCRVGDYIDWPQPIVTPPNASGWVLTGIVVDNDLVELDVASQKIKAIAVGTDTVEYVAENADGSTVTGTLNLVVNPALVPLAATMAPAGTLNVNLNANFTLTVQASGGELPYLYEFYCKGVLQASQATNVYTRNANDFALAGDWTARVVDTNGMYVVTNTTVVNVVAPAIVINDFSRVTQGYVGKLSSLTPVVSGGRPPYTFLWLQDGVPTSMITQQWRITSTKKTDDGLWTLRVTDSLGTVQDSTGGIDYQVNATQVRPKNGAGTTNPWPVVTNSDTAYTIKVDLNATANSDRTFDVDAFDYDETGKPVIPDGQVGYEITGTPNNSTVVKVSDTQFRVTPTAVGTAQITLAKPSSGSRPTTVNVVIVRLPKITTQPANTSVVSGATATFNVVVDTGGVTTNYQWQVKSGSTWSAVAGATAATLTINNATVAMNGNVYRCVVSNADGSVTSNEATLTVTA